MIILARRNETENAYHERSPERAAKFDTSSLAGSGTDNLETAICQNSIKSAHVSQYPEKFEKIQVPILEISEKFETIISYKTFINLLQEVNYGSFHQNYDDFYLYQHTWRPLIAEQKQWKEEQNFLNQYQSSTFCSEHDIDRYIAVIQGEAKRPVGHALQSFVKNIVSSTNKQLEDKTINALEYRMALVLLQFLNDKYIHYFGESVPVYQHIKPFSDISITACTQNPIKQSESIVSKESDPKIETSDGDLLESSELSGSRLPQSVLHCEVPVVELSTQPMKVYSTSELVHKPFAELLENAYKDCTLFYRRNSWYKKHPLTQGINEFRQEDVFLAQLQDHGLADSTSIELYKDQCTKAQKAKSTEIYGNQIKLALREFGTSIIRVINQRAQLNQEYNIELVLLKLIDSKHLYYFGKSVLEGSGESLSSNALDCRKKTKN